MIFVCFWCNIANIIYDTENHQMKRNFTKQDFYAMLTPNGDCLEWSGPKNGNGYGFTRIGNKHELTHRLAVKLEGIVIDGKHILHSCDNPACCNPSHLRVGTAADNMKDKVSRNRQHKGECHYASKFTEQDIIDIRALQGIHSHQTIANRYEVSREAITAIINRRSWKHI